MLPTVDFFGTQITRLILGDNPINGHSYIQYVTPGSEMMDYYTADRCVEMLFEAEKAGINTFLPLATDFDLRVIRQYRNSGGSMHLIYQPYTAIPLSTNIPMMMGTGPLAIYHQGTTTDYLTETDNLKQLKENIRMLRDTGLPVGLGTHVPETILRAEEENWGIDFYMACLYNARRNRQGEQSGFITGKTKEGLVFNRDDKYTMFKVIQKVPKPFLVYKLLAGGQVFYGHTPEEYHDVLYHELEEVYANMKSSDVGVIGVFQRDHNQIAEDAAAVAEILAKQQVSGTR